MRIFGIVPHRFNFELIEDYVCGKSKDAKDLLKYRDDLFDLILGSLVQTEYLVRHIVITKKLHLSFMQDLKILTGKLKISNDKEVCKDLIDKIDYTRRLVNNLSKPSVG
jgi:hypothetical protein